MLSVRLAAYPVVSKEHHRFFAVFMTYIHKFFYGFCYKPLHEIHILLEFLRGVTEAVIVIPAVYEIFRNELYSAFFFKVFDKYGVCSLRVPEPFHLLFFSFFVKNKGELIKEGGKPHYARFGVSLTPTLHIFLDIFFGFRKRGVVR